jgi:serine/threonine protein kinase
LTNRSGNSIGNLYLVDFGSVQTVASKDSGTITIVGSYGYMPFEQFSGQTTIASDLYSFGMTLIYLMTGVHPAELPQVNGRVQFKNTAISNSLIRWLEKMTHPFADQRFDSAKVAIAELKSKHGSHSDDSHLIPVGSNVKLYRDQNKLEIVFEKRRKKQISGVIAIFWIFGIIFTGGAMIFALLMINILINVIQRIINKLIEEDAKKGEEFVFGVVVVDVGVGFVIEVLFVDVFVDVFIDLFVDVFLFLFIIDEAGA